MKQLFTTKNLYHISAIVVLLIIATIYCKPILDNKKLAQHDLIQATGAAQEVENYYKKSGEYPLWTNSMFGGMPAYTIKGEFPNSWTSRVASVVSYILPDPINYIYMLFIGFYIAMAAMGYKPMISFFGAVAFGLSSYSLISLEAGHASKVLAIAFAAPLTAGIINIYRGAYLKGIVLASIFMMFELYSNHIQITYYLAIALFIYVIILFIQSVREKMLKNFFTASSIVLGISIIVLGSMSTRFMDMYEYQKYTIRGPSELTNTDKESVSTTGLDRDYAFNWSYGISETFNYLIPNYKGGKSGAALDEKSAIYKTIENNFGKENAIKFAKAEQWPIYWGDQPGTSGPAYMGAVICFLFILALFIIKDSMKWWMLGIVVLFTILAWGKNSPTINYFIFDHLPLYNKFRAVTMIHAIVAMFMVWLAVWGVSEIGNIDKTTLKKYLKYTTAGVAGLLVVFWLFGSAFTNFEKSNEEDALASKNMFIESWTQASQKPEFANAMYESLIQDRSDALSSDALRSLLFVLLVAGVLYLYATTDVLLKPEYIIALLCFFVIIDEWQISKRYLNDADFKKRKSTKLSVLPTSADDLILQDPDPNFRVMNVTVSTFNDATTSFFHKSIGGYSAAKLRRFQDLVDRQISKNNMEVLNMLNTKYFIVQNPSNGEPMAQRNPNANGNAWFVNNVLVAKNADEEMALLDSLNSKETAVISQDYYSKIKFSELPVDSTATIKLIAYHPDKLTYESASSKPQLAVFSEIYYNSGLGWDAFIDGKQIDHLRVDYLLRGLQVPAGKHQIEFKFEPKTHTTGESISLIFSIIFFGGLFATGFFLIKKEEM
ncbi:hypothetical protein [uncultured Cytophaga sp.]|uniref:hypothetical protein n=1 Tax=uncultured Cytophaga sp. TaxID=160238 RepID=UPI00263890D1|nr:hypothetical protein [uncultured Cytophaga sp.]